MELEDERLGTDGEKQKTMGNMATPTIASVKRGCGLNYSLRPHPHGESV
jgi:hypothetical protein